MKELHLLDSKDAPLLIYLSPPALGVYAELGNAGIRTAPVAGGAHRYESRKALTHHAPPVKDEGRWVLKIFIGYPL